MLRANIAVLVSGGGTNLQALIDAEKSGIIKSGRISLVVSNKEGAYALERAEKAGINTKTILKSEIEELKLRKQIKFGSVSLFSSVAKSCLTLWDPMN